ncbi:uncharacterized protein LOC142390085, partial [Odontesthes bonariensis]|uniref:uncharacterized protein LOC142390085 n=1 Tax=Odontesthes bonariensis TaxID=219752 RepID=UPI003F588BA2
CEGENKLILTDQTTAQNGRYRIDYNYETSVFSVSIEHLTTSDSGRYRCGLGRSSSLSSFRDFKLVVADALLKGTQEEAFYREAGSSLTVGCSFNVGGSTKSFCRGECEEKILVQTDGDRAQTGRYSIGYEEGTYTGGVLYVTITQLTPSDSGRLFVSFVAAPSASTPTTTQSFSSRSGSSAPSASSGTADQSVPPQHEGTTSTDVRLIVGLTVAVTVILLSVALLVFCRRRSCKPLTGLRTRRKSDNSNMENVTYENCTPPTCEDSTYQSLDPASRDQNQVYSTLTEHL